MTHTRTVLTVAFAAVLSVGLAGCAKKKPAPAPPPPPPPAATPAPPPPPPPPPPPAPPQRRRRSEEEQFARKTLDELNAEKPLGDVFFELDSADLTDEARAALQKNADWLKRWTTTKITVEGHCDSRGTTEYNLALGERRAAAVQDYLVSLGVAADRVTDRQQGQGSAVLHGRERSLLAAEPPRPLHHHGEVGRRRSQAGSEAGSGPTLAALTRVAARCGRQLGRDLRARPRADPAPR